MINKELPLFEETNSNHSTDLVCASDGLQFHDNCTLPPNNQNADDAAMLSAVNKAIEKYNIVAKQPVGWFFCHSKK